MKRITIRGFVWALMPIGLYNAWLLLGTLWTDFPSRVLFESAAAQIYPVIAFLFWSVLKNHTPEAVSNILVRLPFVSVVVIVLEFLADEGDIRTGGLSLVFIPLTVPFCIDRIARGRHPRWAVASLVVALAILTISRSRSPLAAGLVAGFIAVLLLGKSVLNRLKVVLIGSAALGLALLLILSFEPTRLLLAGSYVRLTGKDLVVDGVYFQAEPKDEVRVQLDELFRGMVREAQPFGTGFGSTPDYYQRQYISDIAVSLHNVYQAWVLEGGVICVVIVMWILIRHFRAIWHAVRGATIEARAFPLAIGIATVAHLAVGFFHQVHLAPALWMLLGLGAALRKRQWRGLAYLPQRSRAR